MRESNARLKSQSPACCHYTNGIHYFRQYHETLSELKTMSSLREQAYIAIFNGDVAKIKNLFVEDETCIVASHGNYTLLHLAAFENQDEIINLLCGLKIPVDAKDSTGFTPMHYAVLTRSKNTILTLHKQGAESHFSVSLLGTTPVDFCVRGRQDLIVKDLYFSRSLCEVLYYASHSDHLKSVKHL